MTSGLIIQYFPSGSGDTDWTQSVTLCQRKKSLKIFKADSFSDWKCYKVEGFTVTHWMEDS